MWYILWKGKPGWYDGTQGRGLNLVKESEKYFWSLRSIWEKKREMGTGYSRGSVGGDGRMKVGEEKSKTSRGSKYPRQMPEVGRLLLWENLTKFSVWGPLIISEWGRGSVINNYWKEGGVYSKGTGNHLTFVRENYLIAFVFLGIILATMQKELFFVREEQDLGSRDLPSVIIPGKK